MSENPVRPVDNVPSVEPNVAASQLYNVYQNYRDKLQKQTNRGYEASNSTNLSGKKEIPTLDPAKVDEESAKAISKIAPNLGQDTMLKFEVDAQANKVTVLVVDKATEKIVTTIPPEAIKDIPSGDLLQYSV